MFFLQSSVGTAAQDDDSAEIVKYEESLIIPEVTGNLDEFGRAPFFRLTFQPTAGIGPEDLPTPFSAYVESGSFTYRSASGTWSELNRGIGISVGSGEDFGLRNADRFDEATLLVLALPGSCLRFADVGCMPYFLPYDSLCDGPCRPDVSNTLLFPSQDPKNRLLIGRVSVISMAIPAGTTIESLDMGGVSEVVRLNVRIESGSLVDDNGNAYGAGDEFTAQPGDRVLIGDSGAKLIVLRFAEVIESE